MERNNIPQNPQQRNYNMMPYPPPASASASLLFTPPPPPESPQGAKGYSPNSLGPFPTSQQQYGIVKNERISPPMDKEFQKSTFHPGVIGQNRSEKMQPPKHSRDPRTNYYEAKNANEVEMKQQCFRNMMSQPPPLPMGGPPPFNSFTTPPPPLLNIPPPSHFYSMVPPLPDSGKYRGTYKNRPQVGYNNSRNHSYDQHGHSGGHVNASHPGGNRPPSPKQKGRYQDKNQRYNYNNKSAQPKSMVVGRRKGRKKTVSEMIPKRPWNENDAKLAVQCEREFRNLKNNQQILLRFPDPELSTDLVKRFHNSIVNAHFQSPAAQR